MTKNSLLPYLNGPGIPFSLELPTLTGDAGTGGLPRFPFEIVSDGGKLARILGARIVSDGGGSVRGVFLLFSRDEYLLDEGGISPLTNPDIEAAFRAAFRQHLGAGALIPLSGQMDASGDLQPFNALFTCLHTGRFFHPPCPQCGSDLDLVRDDGVLAGAGLMKFSTSLRRYLSCPSCPATTGRAFYSFRPAGAD
ncbi:MAG: hypothetical protein MUD15_12510, partial [Desulfobacterota bacterium]|nr:hypothetical protein [Thermodesulfobacteriota bacterium]